MGAKKRRLRIQIALCNERIAVFNDLCENEGTWSSREYNMLTLIRCNLQRKRSRLRDEKYFLKEEEKWETQ